MKNLSKARAKDWARIWGWGKEEQKAIEIVINAPTVQKAERELVAKFPNYIGRSHSFALEWRKRAQELLRIFRSGR